MSASQADAIRMLCATIHRDHLPASAVQVIMVMASPAPQVRLLECHHFLTRFNIQSVKIQSSLFLEYVLGV